MQSRACCLVPNLNLALTALRHWLSLKCSSWISARIVWLQRVKGSESSQHRKSEVGAVAGKFVNVEGQLDGIHVCSNAAASQSNADRIVVASASLLHRWPDGPPLCWALLDGAVASGCASPNSRT